jgi:hypothetical protein
MDEAIVIQWMQGNWLAFILAFIPPLIAELKGRPKTRWYLYGVGLHSACLAPGLAANDTRPPSATTERHV